MANIYHRVASGDSYEVVEENSFGSYSVYAKCDALEIANRLITLLTADEA